MSSTDSTDSTLSSLSSYLSACSLDSTSTTTPVSIVAPIFATPSTTTSFTQTELQKLYTYTVPEVVEDGECSRASAKEPFNLTTVPGLGVSSDSTLTSAITSTSDTPITLQDQSLTTTQYLIKLNQVIAKLYEVTKCDWLGIYKLFPNMHVEKDVSYPGLVKLAYHGEFSRAIFPLSPHFLETSNNTWVAINKKAKIIKNTRKYDGPYYSCSSRVLSELCAPILTPSGDVIGIIDAESWTADYFTPEITAQIISVCHELGQPNTL